VCPFFGPRSGTLNGRRVVRSIKLFTFKENKRPNKSPEPAPSATTRAND
jgi:hypothetical protein